MKDYEFYKMLSRVEKPGRYVGKEINSYVKNPKEVDVRFAFTFPDIYEIGMSHLGMHILYNLINELDYAWCERVFSPALDMEKELRENNLPMFSLESRTPLKEFDFLGFTLQFELSFTNILNIMDMSGIELFSKDRNNNDPIIIVGGPCAYNLEPIADFVDIAQIGEGEEIMVDFLNLYRKHKNSGRYSKKEFLLDAARKIEGIYVPAFYDVEYNEDGTVKKVCPNEKDVPEIIKKRIVKDIENIYYPHKVLVPNIDIVHDRMMLELFRGCTRGCRFCQAGTIYRPIREKSVERLVDDAKKIYSQTGHDEFSLSSLSSTDYTKIGELVDALKDEFEEKYVSISLPSLRLDNFSLEMAQKLQTVKKTSLTFALEAGSQRMRDVINKGISIDDYKNTLTKIFTNGWNRVKIYFMIGLPYEKEEDLKEIANAGVIATELFKELNGKLPKGMMVTLSSSCFVPKPFTPFQWSPQNSIKEFEEKQYFVKGLVRDKHIKFTYSEANAAMLEAAISRGDRRQSSVIYRAFKKGCKFDSWNEQFLFDKWKEAFEEEGLTMEFYANRQRDYEEVLPWDHIDTGVRKEFLIRENEKAKKEVTTIDCRKICTGCGINADIGKGLCG